MRRVAILTALLALAASSPAGAGSFYLTPDVPADLAAITFLPWQVVRHDAGSYASALTLPAGVAIDALHATESGAFLFSLDAPGVLGGLAVEPEDVVRFDGSGYTMIFDGSAHGVPPGSNLDTFVLPEVEGFEPHVGFDSPVELGGVAYEPADLIRFDGASFSLAFDASAATPPIPQGVNVTAADRRGVLTLLAFDVPVTLGIRTYLPGEVASWDGSGFAPYFTDPAWPPGGGIAALALPPPPGMVPPTIDVAIASPPGGRLRLRISWEESCSAGAEDYALYEGTLGSWYSHTALDCSDEGADRVEEITPGLGDRYYLVVPLNPNEEGSYGADFAGVERPRGTATCAPAQSLGACR